MAGNLKGLTIELAGDTTKLDKALESVNKKSRDLSSELGQVNRLLRMDPGNADLLAQKQEILAEAVQNTSQKLETLKEAERQVQAQFERGEVSAEQVRALQREIVDTTNRLGQYENAARETAEAIERLGREGDDGIRDTGDAADVAADDLRDLEDAARDAGDGLDTAGVAAGTFLGNLATKALEAVSGFLRDCADAAIEYRTEMGKLDVAFTNNGFSAEAAKGAYKDLVGVLGETDQSVEAANHLAILTDNEKDLATWTGDILPGVFATFGDSLPIEGLTEAANETAKVGQVTGPLADALNWAGISEDAFNESLAKCTSEQERQKLIMETLSGLYGEASEKYKETNADVIAANQATDSWNAAMAAAGTAVLPVITAVKEFGAELLERMVPAIQAILDNLPAIGVAMAGTAAAVVAFKVAAMAATAATQGMTLAQKAAAAAQAALNVVMSANPIGLVILAITALVTAFVLLWNNCEGFREFWINLWEKIKTAAITAMEGLQELPSKIYEAIKDAIQRVTSWGSDLANRAKTAATNLLNNTVSILKNVPAKIYDAIKDALDRVKKWGDDLVNRAKTAATNLLNNTVSILKNVPAKIYDAIKDAIQRVTSWGNDMVTRAKTAATDLLNNVVNILKDLPSKIYNAIKDAISRITSWGNDMVSKAKSAMTDLVSTVTGIVSELPGKFLSIGKDIIQGLINGIDSMVSSLYSSIKNSLSGLVEKAKDALGISSPSRVFREEVGAEIPPGIAAGIEASMDDPVQAIERVNRGMIDAAATDVGGIQLERQLSRPAVSSVTATAAGGGLGDKLDRILAAIERGQVLTIDGAALVGATADRYDATLGQRRALAARGAV